MAAQITCSTAAGGVDDPCGTGSRSELPARTLRAALVPAAAALALVLCSATPAAADAPTVEDVSLHTVQTLSGEASPCPFPVTFTGDGTVRVTTHYDRSGEPVRQSVHGSLDHTIYSSWHTLYSPGPAAVHIDPETGQSTGTGLAYRFRVQDEGVVLILAGRLVLGPDGGLVDFTGLDRLDAEALCAALAP